MSASEALLLKRFASNGDAEAFAQIIKQHAPLIYGVCLRILEDKDKAADAVQDTFFQLVRNAANISDSLTIWLHRVATNKAIDLLRQDSQRKQREIKYAAEPEQIESEQANSTWQEISGYVDEELYHLDEQMREVLILHFLQGWTPREIAKKCGISHQTVSRRLESGIVSLRHQLRRRGIIAPAAILAAMLSENIVKAAPASLMDELGKMAIACGTSTGARIAAGISAGTTIKAKIIAAASLAIIGASSAVIYSSYNRSTDTSGVASSIAAETVISLLDKYAATQDKIQSSFIIKTQSLEVAATNHPLVSNPGKLTNSVWKTEYRFDGKQYSMQTDRWLDVNSFDHPESLTLNHQSYNYISELWDDKAYFYYTAGVNRTSGQLSIEYGRFSNAYKLLFGQFLGRFAGDDERFAKDDQRIDKVLRRADKIFLHEQKEKVGEFNCYVIDAVFNKGNYTLWIDPNHGYNIAKAKIEKVEGSLAYGRVLEKGWTISDYYEVTRFDKFDGIWFPKEVKGKGESTWDTNYYSRGEGKTEIISVNLNPDHKALDSFDIQSMYIKDGSDVIIDGRNGHTFHEGKVINRYGSEVNLSTLKLPS
jgi:RNA polymerase sigma factor (sigma-70 family)